MQKISLARRIPDAYLCAPLLRKLRSISSSLIVLLLVTTLAFPVLLLTRAPRTQAAPSAPMTAPISAPPEPFTVGSHTKAPLLTKEGWQRLPQTGWFSAALTGLKNSRSDSPLPAGFEVAKVPTFMETLASHIGSVFALITPSKSAIRNPNSAIAAPPPPSGTVLFDFDGDGKADIGRWHSANTEFKVRNSGDESYSTYTIGSSSAVPAPGDFDGDGKTDAAVFNAGSWTIKKSSNGSTQNISFGTTGDKPVAADYDGDGKSDAAVFRPSTNVWWILKNGILEIPRLARSSHPTAAQETLSPRLHMLHSASAVPPTALPLPKKIPRSFRRFPRCQITVLRCILPSVAYPP
jgi:hypothetical protein